MAESKAKDKGVFLTTTAIVFWVIVTVLVVVGVGLIAGLVGKSPAPDCNCPISEVSTPESSTIIPTSEAADTTAAVPSGPWSNIRLPSSLQPSHYVVNFQPYLVPDNSGYYRFNGSSEVTFNVIESTKTIVIHSYLLTYTRVTAFSKDGESINIVDFWLYDVNQYLIVELEDNLSRGLNYTLKTEFHGEISASLGGLYRSSYWDASGNSITMMSSQMWPTDARKAFPCFDEPALKATYDVTLWHQDPYIALSNMPVRITETFGEWKRTQFLRTPIMSSYLLTVIVHQFEYEESAMLTQPEVKTRTYARPDQVRVGNVDYANYITPIILDYYAEYFEVKYPLPKLDEAAIPDFKFGGMENWGLVTYRETALLFDPLKNSGRNQQRVAEVVAHEMAHQWFGNLISPQWFDELWLSEGFATFIEYLGQDKVEPTWRIMDQFVLLDLHIALTVDGLVTSRAIVAENVSSNADIQALVDDITYSKAGSVIRMINHFTGEDAFKLGLQNYLKEYAYGSVEHTQLFEFWEAAAITTNSQSLPPGGYVHSMNTWVLQMGYPVIDVKRDPNNPNRMFVQQQRFLLDPKADVLQPASQFNYKWVVPFWFKRDSDANKTLVWLNLEKDITIDVLPNEYVIGNYEVYGYYRVNYDLENWRKIINELNSNFDKINVKSRGQIIDDAFNLARSGKLDYSVALNTTMFLQRDLDYIPWQSALDVLEYCDQMLARSKVYGVFSQYLRDLSAPLLLLNWTDADHLKQFQRVNSINVPCTYGDELCIENTIFYFNTWLRNPSDNPIDPDVREAVYCQAIANGNSSFWDFLWENYQTETDSQEKTILQKGLTCTKEYWIIQKLLELSLIDDYVRKQDAPDILMGLCDNDIARDLTWDFLLSEWDVLYEIYGLSATFGRIIEACTARFSTNFELRKLKALKEYAADKLGSGARAVDQAIEKTQTNIDWRNQNEDVLFEWFSNAVSNL